MRSLVASLVLGLGALGFVAAAPTQAQAAPPCGPKTVCVTPRVPGASPARVSYRTRTAHRGRAYRHTNHRGRGHNRGHVRHVHHRGDWSNHRR